MRGDDELERAQETKALEQAREPRRGERRSGRCVFHTVRTGERGEGRRRRSVREVGRERFRNLHEGRHARSSGAGRGEILRQVGERRAEQTRRPSGGQRAHLRERKRDGVCSERERWDEEVSGGHDLARLHEHERVVAGAVQLGLEGGG